MQLGLKKIQQTPPDPVPGPEFWQHRADRNRNFRFHVCASSIADHSAESQIPEYAAYEAELHPAF
jgi:hypothetical protein